MDLRTISLPAKTVQPAVVVGGVSINDFENEIISVTVVPIENGIKKFTEAISLEISGGGKQISNLIEFVEAQIELKKANL